MMKSRYDADGLAENRTQPGSRGRVLENLIGISSRREIDRIEARHLFDTHQRLVQQISPHHQFTAGDICAMHLDWLGTIYPWAGRFRQVNLSKGSITFAAATVIPRLMMALEAGPLRQFTPCRFVKEADVIQALSVVHAELILIHPFREGNGRLGRLLSVLMALQAGLPPLDFGGIRGKTRQEYFQAVQIAVRRDYTAMEQVFMRVIRRTQRAAGAGGPEVLP